MIKSITVFVCVVLLGTLAYFLFIPRYKFKFYQSQDKSQGVTKVTRMNPLLAGESVYITYGYYRKWRIPDSYVQPFSYGLGSYWEMYIHFLPHKVIVLNKHGGGEAKNINPNMLFYPSAFKDNNLALAADSIIKIIEMDKTGNVYQINSLEE